MEKAVQHVDLRLGFPALRGALGTVSAFFLCVSPKGITSVKGRGGKALRHRGFPDPNDRTYVSARVGDWVEWGVGRPAAQDVGSQGWLVAMVEKAFFNTKRPSNGGRSALNIPVSIVPGGVFSPSLLTRLVPRASCQDVYVRQSLSISNCVRPAFVHEFRSQKGRHRLH